QMPPSGPLTAEQIDLVKAWIDQGAEWPDALSGEKDSKPPDSVVVKMSTFLRNGDHQNFVRTLEQNPNSVNSKSTGGWTPLMYAALYGDGVAIRLLIDKGASVNSQNHAGGTALMSATEDAEKTKALLDHGANPNVRSGEGRTALLIAAGQTGSYPVVKLL